MNRIANDRASESRAANNNLATLTAQDGLINNRVKLDKGFPMNMKVDFNHPTLSNDGIVIFFDIKIPHLIKKIVNILERSSLSEHNTALHFHGHNLSLNMINQLWCESGSILKDSIRNVNNLTKDPFLKNNYSRMRVHLAPEFFSKNDVNMIDDYAVECGGKEKCGLLREVLFLLNDFIDIMNEKRSIIFQVQMMKNLKSY